jgi:hypothetical protein
MGNMSASDAAPLPRLGEVFFDVRGSSRSLRLSWYADTSVAVFSIWQAGTCTGTFRLPMGDLDRMIETLRRGPDGLPGRGLTGAEPGYAEPGYPGAEPARPGAQPGYPDAEPEYGEATEAWSGWDEQDDGPPGHQGPGVSGGYPARTGAPDYHRDYSAAPSSPDHYRGGAGHSSPDHFRAGAAPSSADPYRADPYRADHYRADHSGADHYGADHYGADRYSAEDYSTDGYSGDDYAADGYAGDYAGDYAPDYAGDRTQAHYLPAPAHSGYGPGPGRSSDVSGSHNGEAVRGPAPRGRPPESFPYGPPAAPER